MVNGKHFSKIEKTSLFDKKLGLDPRDRKIMALIQKDPDISQADIAASIKLSQPSVGARMRKLKAKGLINAMHGINFKVADLKLAKVDVRCMEGNKILKKFMDCPFFLNGLITSGRFNLCLFFMATDLKRLEYIIDHHLRSDPSVRDMEMDIVITAAKDFILPASLDSDHDCSEHCKDCI